MNKRKVWGAILVIFGLIMVAGSTGSMEQYGLAAPISMALIVVVGLAMIFWEKVQAWFS